MILGVSAKIKDRRIDKCLETTGYNPGECDIYYSPIIGYYFYVGISIFFIIPLWFILKILILKYLYFFIIYYALQYLVLAYINNSYAIYQNKLIAINPNFPFKKMTVFELTEIDKIKIGNSRLGFTTWILLILSSNYIEIYTTDKTQRFYSVLLEVDCFDENITEKTIDNFNTALCKHNIVTEFNL